MTPAVKIEKNENRKYNEEKLYSQADKGKCGGGTSYAVGVGGGGRILLPWMIWEQISWVRGLVLKVETNNIVIVILLLSIAQL